MMIKQHRSFTFLVFLLSLIILLTGCKPVNIVDEVTPAATVMEQTIPTVVENLYPSTPEEVVRAFMLSYPTDQIYAIQYLSPTYVKNLDAQSVENLLPETGNVNGFIIESGSTSAEDAKSEVFASVAFEKSTSKILFNLEIVDGRWAINKISTY